MWYLGPYATSPYLCAAAAGLCYECYIIRSGPECFSPITRLRSNLIWLLHSVSSLPYLLLHRLLKSPHASSHTHINTHAHRWLCVPAHQAQNTLAKLGVNHYTKSSLQSPVTSQKAVGVREGDRLGRSDWFKNGKRVAMVRRGGCCLWTKEEKRSRKMKKKKEDWEMDQDAWLVSPSHPNHRGNVMETLECFQTLSTIATMW